MNVRCLNYLVDFAGRFQLAVLVYKRYSMLFPLLCQSQQSLCAAFNKPLKIRSVTYALLWQETERELRVVCWNN